MRKQFRSLELFCLVAVIAFRFSRGEAPVITQGPEDKIVVKGDVVVFECKTENPADKIDWLRKRPSDSSPKTSPSTTRWKETELRLSYQIHDDDGVEITCLATSDTSETDFKIARLTMMMKPNKPESFQLSRLGSTIATFSWNQLEFSATQPVDGYILEYRLLNKSEDWIRSNDTTSRSGKVENLVPFGTYEFRLIAFNRAGESEPSSVITETALGAVPSGPPIVDEILPSRPDLIQIRWTYPIEEVKNGLTRTITGFTVRYNDMSKVTQNLEMDLTSSDGIKPFTSYTITVSANTSAGEGPQTSSKTTETPQAAPNSPPQNVAALPIKNGFRVTWDKPASSEWNGILHGYKLCYKHNSQEECRNIEGENQLSYDVTTNIKAATEYSVTVQAFTNGGFDDAYGSPKSSAVTVQTHEKAPSAAPANLRITSSEPTSLVVEWEEIPEDSRNGMIVGYKLRYGKKGNRAKIVPLPPDAQSHTLSDLDEHTEYNISISGSTSEGDGPWSNWISYRTDNDVPAAAPSNVRILSRTSNSLEVSWDALRETEWNDAMRKYIVTLNGTDEISTTETKATLGNLKPYTVYEIRVRAKNGRGLGPDGKPIWETTSEGVPSEPIMHFRERHNHKELSLEWDPPKSPRGIITGYELSYRLADSSSGFTTINLDAGTRAHKIGPLIGNLTYEVKLRAKNSAGYGPYATQTASTIEGAPDVPPGNIRESDLTSTSVTISWDVIPREHVHGVVRRYHLKYGLVSEEKSLWKTDTTAGSQRKITLQNLKPYKKYGFQVAAKTNKLGLYSNVFDFTTREGVPGWVTGLGSDSTSTSVTLTWKPPLIPNGLIRNYLIEYRKNGETEQKMRNITGTEDMATIRDLKPYTVYQFHISAVTGGGRNFTDWIDFSTDEDRPGQPKNLKAEAKHMSVHLQWESPDETNGIIRGYRVVYKAFGRVTGNYLPNGSVFIAGTKYTFQLQPLVAYTFKVSAFTSKGDGNAADASKTVPSAAPSYTPVPKKEPGSTATFSLEKPSTLFGEISFYQIRLFELPPEESPRQRRSTGEKFRIIAQFGTLPAKFIVGDNQNYSSYQNKPLKEGRYQIALSSHVTRDGLGDDESMSNRSQIFTITPTKETRGSSPNLYLIIGIVAGILVLALIILLVVVFTRRRQSRQSEVVQAKVVPVFADDTEKTPVSAQNSIDYLRHQNRAISEKYPPVRIADFENHVKRLQANGNSKFTQEYEVKKVQNLLKLFSLFFLRLLYLTRNLHHLNHNSNAMRRKIATATLLHVGSSRHLLCPINKSIFFSDDHSRVRLNAIKGEQGSDYINANFIDGHDKKNAYIATQGPLKETAKDFWRMVWEQQSSTIVMLTNLEERGRSKCYKYWPDSGSEVYESIQVTLKDVVMLADYTVRVFEVARTDRPDDCREVKQFHFTCWPDHGVPQYATAMLAFIRKVKSANSSGSGPMVVHCSAGVGRTGAFIVIDAMLDRMLDSDVLDIFGHVLVLRSQRNFMVQTEDQYFFIHEAILEAIQCGNTEINARDLPHSMQKLGEVIADDGSTAIELEFKRLAMDKLDPSRFLSANRSVNKSKNRFVNILPFESSRVPLMYMRGVEGSDYINGSFIDGYKQRHAFIATQGPLIDTEHDFWRMIWEQESKIIVMLTKLSERGQEKCHKYWPDGKPARYGAFVIEPLSEQRKADCILRQFKLTNTSDGQARTICQYQYVGWPENRSPVSGRALIDLIGEVQKLQEKTRDRGPVTIHCSAGVGRTGCFVALTIVLERMRCEGVLDIFQTVKTLRIQRPAMVQTLDQYQFVYDTALEYLDSFDHYADYAPLEVQDDEEGQ